MPFFKLCQLLLLLSGDVELNPGPPKRVPGAPTGGPAKAAGPTKEEQLDILEAKRFNCYEIVHAIISYDAIVNDTLVDEVREYEDKFEKLEKNYDAHKKEMAQLKEVVQNLMGIDEKVDRLTTKIDAITGVYDDLHEKMHEIDKTRKNNLILYGIKPDFLPEIPSQLEQKIHEIFRHQLQITRDIPMNKIARMLTGPEVRGCRPVLVNFSIWKDREEVFAKSKLLRGTNIYVTEDLSRKARENRHELTKYMREMRSKSPTKKCILRYDKLYIDNTPYVYDEERNTVVRFYAPEAQRPLSRNNYSSLGDVTIGLTRSTSVPSVNGEHGLHPDNRVGSRTSLNSRRLDFASTESLALTQQGPHPQMQPTLDENPEIEQDKVSISIEITPVEASDIPDPATAPSEPEPEPPKPKYSENSLKTAKKVLTALKKHRKTDQPEEKAETLQLTKKTKEAGNKKDGTPPESSTSSPPAEPAEVLEPTGGDPESSPVGDP